MALTDTAIQATKSGKRPYKVYDRDGLFFADQSQRFKAVALALSFRRQGKADGAGRVLRGIEKARDLSVGEFDHVLHKQRIRSLNSIPTFKALTELVNALEAAHNQPRAA